MAMSLNGMIADDGDQVPWTEPIWQNYFDLVRSYGALIVGRRTYDLMMAENEIARIGDIHVAVLSKQPRSSAGKTYFVTKPAEAITCLQSKGLGRAILGGGTTINTVFLQNGLIKDLVLDMEPVIMPSGKSIFGQLLSPHRAKLEQVKELGGGCLRLHYRL